MLSDFTTATPFSWHQPMWLQSKSTTEAVITWGMTADRENISRVARQKLAHFTASSGADCICRLPIVGDKLQKTSGSTLKVVMMLGGWCACPVWNGEVQFWWKLWGSDSRIEDLGCWVMIPYCQLVVVGLQGTWKWRQHAAPNGNCLSTDGDGMSEGLIFTSSWEEQQDTFGQIAEEIHELQRS
jgi:hypothetical protein